MIIKCEDPTADLLWNDDLQCSLVETKYNHLTRCVTLVLVERHCTDYLGAIKVATKAFPDAVEIRTVSGDVPCTVYRLGVRSGLGARAWFCDRYNDEVDSEWFVSLDLE
ncbi:hypothetical protein [Cupriavidus taiwanensis]|uniref:Uncharacterized protein n=1 Tax=Cupriavidus taiwanensis TaxID=164546 RepID=A0A375J403_9BURK|nr:hypothetical protein [Cupriavidus taiwanensis]SPR99311.1 hypothetical protein CBM2634_A80243 [Cupriavidus taiwanensis]